MADTDESLEERLTRQEEAIKALQDMPKMLLDLKNSMVKSNFVPPEVVKPSTWSLGLTDDDESDNNDAEKLIQGDTPNHDGIMKDSCFVMAKKSE